mmetsp:Transcript_13575/g.34871  ORF Transcript_13575/g.34871 Transcript_13575/m.34871 type:complete len:227 (+) Transcript_13575:433-1113(+)
MLPGTISMEGRYKSVPTLVVGRLALQALDQLAELERDSLERCRQDGLGAKSNAETHKLSLHDRDVAHLRRISHRSCGHDDEDIVLSCRGSLGGSAPGDRIYFNPLADFDVRYRLHAVQGQGSNGRADATRSNRVLLGISKRVLRGGRQPLRRFRGRLCRRREWRGRGRTDVNERDEGMVQRPVCDRLRRVKDVHPKWEQHIRQRHQRALGRDGRSPRRGRRRAHGW